MNIKNHKTEEGLDEILIHLKNFFNIILNPNGFNNIKEEKRLKYKELKDVGLPEILKYSEAKTKKAFESITGNVFLKGFEKHEKFHISYLKLVKDFTNSYIDQNIAFKTLKGAFYTKSTVKEKLLNSGKYGSGKAALNFIKANEKDGYLSRKGELFLFKNDFRINKISKF